MNYTDLTTPFLYCENSIRALCTEILLAVLDDYCGADSTMKHFSRFIDNLEAIHKNTKEVNEFLLFIKSTYESLDFINGERTEKIMQRVEEDSRLDRSSKDSLKVTFNIALEIRSAAIDGISQRVSRLADTSMYKDTSGMSKEDWCSLYDTLGDVMSNFAVKGSEKWHSAWSKLEKDYCGEFAEKFDTEYVAHYHTLVGNFCQKILDYMAHNLCMFYGIKIKDYVDKSSKVDKATAELNDLFYKFEQDMNSSEELKVEDKASLPVVVTQEDINNIMTWALHNGSIDYWCDKVTTSGEQIGNGGTLSLYDKKEGKANQLVKEKLVQGIKMYAEHPTDGDIFDVVNHELHIDRDCVDRDVADAIVQYSVFQKIVYKR